VFTIAQEHVGFSNSVVMTTGALRYSLSGSFFQANHAPTFKPEHTLGADQ